MYTIRFSKRTTKEIFMPLILVDKNQHSLILICFKIPWNLYVRAMQRQMLPLWPDFPVRVVQIAAEWQFYYYSLEQCSDRVLEFCRNVTKDLEWTKYPWGQYYQVHRSVICNEQDLSNLGVFCLTSWVEHRETRHQTPHEIEVRYDQFLGL